ncbi:unnamed protein product [Lymnaea stagnalis]|uniref:Folate receptor-like domain-containing protein n=1 Tax=Lymnaea stagnalis TaxID=6523 RepID=A0AAV2HJQ0_LYMST
MRNLVSFHSYCKRGKVVFSPCFLSIIIAWSITINIIAVVEIDAADDGNKRICSKSVNPAQPEVESEFEEVLDTEGGVIYREKSKYEEKRHKCTFFYSNRFPAYEGGLVNCTWYTSKACCKRTEVTSVFSAMDPLYGASVLCRNYINYLMCFFCSPDQHKFFKANKKVSVCLEYCESLYEECKSAGFNKTLIGEAYTNGTAFCAAQNFEVAESADCFKFDPNVFGYSTYPVPWPALLIFLLFLGHQVVQ